MNTRRPAFLQFLAPVLICALIVQSSPAYALRPAGLEESGAHDEVVTQLGGAAGLEETFTTPAAALRYLLAQPAPAPGETFLHRVVMLGRANRFHDAQGQPLNEAGHVAFRYTASALDHLGQSPGTPDSRAISYRDRFAAALQALAWEAYFSQLPVTTPATLEGVTAAFLGFVEADRLPKSPQGPKRVLPNGAIAQGLGPHRFFRYLPALAADLFQPWVQAWTAAAPLRARLLDATGPARAVEVPALAQQPVWLALPMLQGLLNDADPAVRAAAAAALGRLGDRRALEVLQGVSRNREEPVFVRDAATAAIRALVVAEPSTGLEESVGYLFTPRAIIGNRALGLPGVPALIQRLHELGIPVAMLGGTSEERRIVQEQLGIPVVAPTAIEHYQREIGASMLWVIRDRADPADLYSRVLTVDLTDLARQWPLLLDAVGVTVADLAGLEEANQAAARLLWSA